MWKKFIVITFLIIFVDYIILIGLGAFLFKYYVILHAVMVLINISILLLYSYLIKYKSDFVGLGVMAGLLFKMLLALGIFVVLYNKLHLNDIQIINFLFVYFCYTIVLIVTVLNQKI